MDTDGPRVQVDFESLQNGVGVVLVGSITAVIAAIAFHRFGLLSSPVFFGNGAGSTVVGAVGRVILPSVIVCGRTLVSNSLDAGAEANFIVPASSLTGPESLIKAVPSARQKASVLVSTRLQQGSVSCL